MDRTHGESTSQMSKKQFTHLASHPEYQISKSGVVLGKNGKALRARPKVSARTGNLPYLSVALYTEGVRHELMVHHLVLEAFVGPRPEGHEARHLNGNCQDNRLKNLQWGTPEENAADKVKHRTHCRRCGSPLRGRNILRHVNGKRKDGSDKIVRRCRSCTIDAQRVAYLRRKEQSVTACDLGDG